MIVVDTSFWVDALRNDTSPAAEWVRVSVSQEIELCTCGVIITEILQGVRTPREYGRAREVLDELIYLPMPRRAYLLAADIYREARARGKTIRSTMDCIIAACAIVHDVPLIQRDRDFEVIAGVSDLRLVQP